MTSETSEADAETHLTPDLPPATEAPDLRGASRTRPEEDPIGRRSPLPTPYGAPAPNRPEDRDTRPATPTRTV